MSTLNKLKIAAIISFLIIVLPVGKIPLPNFVILPLLVVQSVFNLFYPNKSFLYYLPDLFISIITITSVFLIFNQKKHFVLGSIIVQILYLCYTFKDDHLKYWYYTLPTLVYLILSLILIYALIFKKKEQNFET